MRELRDVVPNHIYEQVMDTTLIQDRYDELMFYSRKVLRYNGVDQRKFDLALVRLDACVARQLIEIQNEDEECED